MSETDLFIIALNTDDMFIPQAWDAECEGAVSGAMGASCTLALFTSRKTARAAIDVSAKWNALLKAQEKPYNDDFITYKSKMAIVHASTKQKFK